MRYRPNKTLIAVMITALSVTSVPVSGFASIVPTDRIIAKEMMLSPDRVSVNEFLAREDVRSKLQEYGVSSEEASTRVAALSDAEIAQITAKLDQLPAGQDAVGTVVGAALVIFLVLLITDILCLTRVFPFTRCAT
jgi:hypothetical protein